ncbi:class I SAM-dependent methyltransferase [Nocardioides sp.]|uniref:class I SAM-dependent methyltransferase n=1 Tax=Nocardioides sp. TaxID=35761 RepID=UPI002C0210EA|nr:methyltransferase domain-containing protein [Nocardioides sp.]HXH79622.1 methyltransferase domain-containing protein [Nocardioides sp.]
MATTHRILPPSPDLEQLRRDAKSLLKALQAGDISARARVHAVASGLPVRLSTAQLVVAREYGVDSWPQLKELVDRVVAQGTRYDVIGHGYAAYRRPDPRIAAAIHDALGDARTVLNIGAGTGSYEPTDRPVLAVEPSTAMAQQRPAHLPPAVRAVAESLPLADQCVDASMAIMTIQHWTDWRRGLTELRRVTRRRIVLLTIDVAAEADMWLFADYAPQFLTNDSAEFPLPEVMASFLEVLVDVRVVPVPADCTDGMGLSFWSRPETVLDPGARRATSGFARMDDDEEQAIVDRLAADLSSGAWDEQYGRLRMLSELDVGLRLVVAELG